MRTVQLEKFHNCSTTPATSEKVEGNPEQMVMPETALAMATKSSALTDTKPVVGQEDVEEKIAIIKKEMQVLSSPDHNVCSITQAPQQGTQRT